MSARRLALTIPTVIAVLAGALLLSSAPAFALVKHEYLSQLTGFQDPVAMAMDSNSELYVADAGSKTIDRFNAADTPLPFSASEPYIEGSKLTGTPTGAGGTMIPFEDPQGIAVDDASGTIFVSDSTQNVVDVFSPSGEYISQLTGTPTGVFVYPQGITVDQETNELFVTDGYDEIVAVFNSSGQYLSQFGTPAQRTRSIVVNEFDKRLYVNGDGTVEVFGNLGESLLSTWTSANSFFTGTESLGLDQADGQVYVTNTDDGSPVVDEYANSSEEEYEGQLTSPSAGPFTEPQAVVVDQANGDVLVADRSGIVDIFGPNISLPPVITKVSYSTVDSGSANLSARIETGSAPVTYYFEYGTTAAYGSHTMSAIASGKPIVSAHLEGLAPSTEYHFRLVATSSGGSTFGDDVVFRTLPSGTQGLPDGRVYEMVTPIDKEDAEVYVPSAVSHQAEDQAGGYETTRISEVAASGDAVVYQGDPTHNGGGESSGNALGSAYLARRSQGGGWTQASIQPPGRRTTAYRGFSSDLSAGILTSPTENPEQAEPQLPGGNAPAGLYSEGTYDQRYDIYRHAFDEESYQPLSIATPKRTQAEAKGYVVDNGSGEPQGPAYAGGTPDLSQLLFQDNDDALQKGEAEPEKELGEDVNQEAAQHHTESEYLYDWSDGPPLLVDVLPDGRVAPNATFGAPHLLHEKWNGNPPDFSHVISSEGSRVFWSALQGTGYNQRPKALYIRENPTQPQSPLNGQEECTVPTDACTIQLDKGIEGGARFWTASSDGSKAFFTKGALYVYEVNATIGQPGVITDLTPGVEVQGVLGSSEEGDYIYYVNSANELYMLHENGDQWEAPVAIASLSSEDGEGVSPYNGLADFATDEEGHAGDWVPDLGQRTAEVTADGQGLVFMSDQPLKAQGFPNGYETDGQEEVYVYDAERNSLFCASCSQSGESGSSAFLPVSWSDSYIPTWISEKGNRVFFDSPSSLVSRDTNGNMDVYEWEREGTGSCEQDDGSRGGCMYLLSGGSSNEPSWLLGASANGSDVFMITRSNLTGDAQDELYKVFDARIGGVEPLAPPACTGTGCQGVPAAPPTFAAPSSVTYIGVGNFSAPTRVKSVAKAKIKSLTRAQKLAKALKMCRARPKKKRTSCEAQARKRYGPVEGVDRSFRAINGLSRSKGGSK